MVLEATDAKAARSIAQALPDFLRRQRWFAGKAKQIKGCELLDAIPIHDGHDGLHFFLVRVEFSEGHPQTYALPLQQLSDDPQADSTSPASEFILKVDLEDGGRRQAVRLADAPRHSAFANAFLDLIARGDRFRGISGELAGMPTSAFQSLRGPEPQLDARVLSVEQSNTSIVYGRRLILKVFRLIDEGINPEIEICSFLTGRTTFANFAAVAGVLEYRKADGPPSSLGVLQAFVPNQGDAWNFTLGEVDGYLDRVVGSRPPQSASQSKPLLALAEDECPPGVAETIGGYVDSAALLGRRTAELHLALASEPHDPAFAAEPFSPDYQRSMYASMIGLVQQNLGLLRDRSRDLAEQDRELARLVLGRENEFRAALSKVLDRPMTGMRTRVHGDYHLGQVLYTGSDFVIIDFEGEPARPLHERRRKSSPLKDIAGMLRSFHYAAYSVVFQRAAEARANGQNVDAWARYWHTCVSAAFLRSYLRAARAGPFLPKAHDELQLLLDVFLLEKSIYELGYELNNRPAWVRIPLQGIMQTLADQSQVHGA